jgi:hypothetical protein
MINHRARYQAFLPTERGATCKVRLDRRPSPRHFTYRYQMDGDRSPFRVISMEMGRCPLEAYRCAVLDARLVTYIITNHAAMEGIHKRSRLSS